MTKTTNAFRAGLRNAVDQFRVAWLGFESPDVARNRERNEEMEKLQRQINEATDFSELTKARGYEKWREMVQERVSELQNQLRNAGMKDFPLIQAQLKVCEELVGYVPDKIAAAESARERLEALVDEVTA